MKRKLHIEIGRRSEVEDDAHPARELFAGAKDKDVAASDRGGKKSARVVKKRKGVADAKAEYDRLKKTDRKVIDYLKGLRRSAGGTVTASIPKISDGAVVSPRQVQISTARLIEKGLLERVGRDESNPERSKRGTIYRVLIK